MSTKESGERSSSRRGTKRVADEVGYGRPPWAHRFKPGQSGNPRGRPKGAKNEATILRAILKRKIAVREGGRARKMTVLEAILLRFTEEALSTLRPRPSAFPGSRHDDQVDSISQALSHEIRRSRWDDKSLEGFGRFIDGMVTDYCWGRLMGRPW